MKISIILGHPNPASFNHAIASVAVDTLRELGHETNYHDLQAEKFDPVATMEEIPRGVSLPPMIQQHCDEILAAEGIVIVHPNWWCQPPAILKGWVDRVLRAGMAYNFVPDGKGGAKAVGLLKAKTALIITTANTPQEKEVEFYGDPLETFWKKCVFGLCGTPIKERLIFSPVIVSSPEQRAAWLQEVKTTVGRLFPGS